MPLSGGSKLGPYEILSLVGAGGMGEVYRARDTRLDRIVAVKVLPSHLSDNEKLKERFDREARTISSLNHPHICALYDVGHQEGTDYIVMEYLEGETLLHRLEKGPLPAEQVLRFAIQISDALGKAHRQGIIHRDLKPGNIMLTKSGAKLLDFGLAKYQEAPAPEVIESGLQTQSYALTGEGVQLGTIQYMAPEQVEGREADKRTDIFAFGQVIYEMCTGRRAFGGNSKAQLMVAILSTEPPSLSSHGLLVPPALEYVVKKCLAKDPDERWQDAGDVAGHLRWISEGGTQPAITSPIKSRRKIFRRISWLIPIILLSALCVILIIKYLQQKESVTLLDVSFQQITDLGGLEEEPSLSPDGKNIAYVSGGAGNRDIYVVRVGGRNAIDLTGGTEADDQDPAFSPDGQTIAFHSDREGGGIYTVGATGESLKRITDFGFAPTWSPDGKTLAVATYGPLEPTFRQTFSKLYLVEVATGQKKLINENDAVQPAWSPHGDRIAYWGLIGESGQRDIFTMDRNGGGIVPVTSDQFLDWAPAWSADGKYLFFMSNRGGTMNLWRVKINEETGSVLSKPQPVLLPSRLNAHPTISADGKQIAYAAYERHSSIGKIGFDPDNQKTTGSPETILSGTAGVRDIDSSPDGKWVAVRYTAGQEDIVLYSTDRKEIRRLTDDVFKDRGPRFSPDGKRIVFYSDRSGRYEIWSIAADGSGLKQLTQTTGIGYWYPVWSPDAKQIAICNEEGTSIANLSHGLPAKSVKPLPRMSGGIFMATSWSTDGKFLVGGALRTDAIRELQGVFVYSFETGTYQRVSEIGNILGYGISFWSVPRWLNNNRGILFSHNSDMYLLDIISKKSRVLIPSESKNDGVVAAISDDNHLITWSTETMKSDIWMLTMK